MADEIQPVSAAGLYPNPNREAIVKALMARVQGANQQRYQQVYQTANGLPYDYEGLGQAYALKYGRAALEKLLGPDGMQNMNVRQLQELQKAAGQAGNEWDNMYQRERQRGGR